ncbi:MAG: hypothetical protein ACLS61_07590 [Ruminococcus sp.]
MGRLLQAGCSERMMFRIRHQWQGQQRPSRTISRKVETAVDNANQALSTLDFNPTTAYNRREQSPCRLWQTESPQGHQQHRQKLRTPDRVSWTTSILTLLEQDPQERDPMQSVTERNQYRNTKSPGGGAESAGQEIMSSFNIDTSGAGSAGANLMQSVTDGINTGTPEAQAAAQSAGQEIMSSFNIDTSGARNSRDKPDRECDQWYHSERKETPRRRHRAQARRS